MRVRSGDTAKKIYFVAVDSTDLTTRVTGLSSFTVYRSRNGGTATAYTTPTIAELSAANMPGVYALTLDEDTTIDAGDDEQETCLHITHASMAPVTLAYDLYRSKITTGETLVPADLATAAALADVDNYVDTEVAAIKAKTDQLTFTSANKVDANVLHVNSQTIGGSKPYNTAT